jgi:hypothetical protein
VQTMETVSALSTSSHAPSVAWFQLIVMTALLVCVYENIRDGVRECYLRRHSRKFTRLAAERTGRGNGGGREGFGHAHTMSTNVEGR